MKTLRRTVSRAIQLLAVTLAFVASGSAGDDAIHDDWIALDVQLIHRLGAGLPLRRGSVEQLLKALQPNRIDEDDDIGFGLRRIRAVLYGGYKSAWITIVGCDGRVDSIEVHSDHGGPAVSERLRQTLVSSWEGRGGHLGDDTFDGEFHAPGVAEKCSKRRGAQLGAPVSIEPDADVVEAYRVLSSALSRLVFGTSCYYGGNPPLGRTELETILRHEHADMLLANIVRGPNPEGRVYAVEGLLRLAQKGTTLSEETRRAIRWVYRSQAAIGACDGCFAFRRSPKEALSAFSP